MTTEIGSIRAKMELDARSWKQSITETVTATQKAVRDIQKSLKDTDKPIDDAAKKMREIGDGAEAAGQAAAKGFAVIAAAVALATREAVKFESAMKDIQSLTDASTAQMNTLGDAIKKVAPDRGMFASDVATGLADMIRAGAQLPDILNDGAAAMTNLAKAGKINNDQAGELLATTKATYGEAVGSYTNIANLLANASNGAAGSMNDLSVALKQVESTAHGAGMSFQDVLTAVGTLENQGVIGEQAGTQIKTMIERLVPNSAEAIAIFKQLGLQTEETGNKFFTASGKLKDLNSIVQILHDTFGRFNQQARIDILNRLFGQDASGAVLTLMDATDKVKAFQAQLGDTTAANVAAAQMDTVQGALDRMKSEVSIASAELGQAFMPAVKEAAKGIGDLAAKYNSLSPSAKKAAADVTAGATATAATTAGAGLAAAAVFRLGDATTALGKAFTFLKGNPWIWAISLAVGGLTAWYEHIQQVREETQRFDQAQKELNETLAKNPLARTVDDLKSLQDAQKQVNSLVYQQKVLMDEIAKAKTPTHEQGLGATNDWAQRVGEVKKFQEQLDQVNAQLKELGVAPEQAAKSLAQMNDQIAKSVPALLKMKQQEIEDVAAKQTKISTIDSLAKQYNELNAKQSLSADETAHLTDVTNQLSQEIPSLIVQIDDEGRAHIQNIGIIGERQDAEKALVKTQAEAITTYLTNLRNSTDVQAKEIETQIKNLQALADAYNAMANGARGKVTGDDRVPDNQARRLFSAADEAQQKAADLQKQDNELRVNRGQIDDALKRVSKGDFSNGKTAGGTDSWTPPPTGAKGKTADQLAQETYQRDLAAENQRYATGEHDLTHHIVALKAIQSDYSDWLAKHESERFSLSNDIAQKEYKVSEDWTTKQEATMRAAGKTDVEIAQMRIDAWTRVTQRTNLLAADRQQAEQNLAAAKHDLDSATYANSVNWIDREAQTMKDAGKSELDIAEMREAAWERINAKIASGTFSIEHQTDATKNLAQATRDVEVAMVSAMQAARQKQAEMFMDDLASQQKAEENAIQAQIDGLDDIAAKEQYITNLKKEQATLAQLEADRAAVAADKRFEIITRDKNGNLVRQMVADLPKLKELDKQIAEQKTKIAQMQADEERRIRREGLEKQLKDLQEEHEKERKAWEKYWSDITSGERIAQELRNKETEVGLRKTLALVQSYAMQIEQAYADMQASASAALGTAMPGGTFDTSTTPTTSWMDAGSVLSGAAGAILGKSSSTGITAESMYRAAAASVTPTQAMFSALSASRAASDAQLARSVTNNVSNVTTNGAPMNVQIHVTSNSADPRKVAQEVQNEFLASIRKARL